MATEAISNAEFESKKEFVLPTGATIVSKTSSISVKEIENGFILRKSYDIKWIKKDGDDSQYEYYSKEWYSKENPLQITLPEEKSLASKL